MPRQRERQRAQPQKPRTGAVGGIPHASIYERQALQDLYRMRRRWSHRLFAALRSMARKLVGSWEMGVESRRMKLSGELVGGHSVGQVFVSQQANLCRIDLIMATHKRENSGQLILHLRDDPASSVDLATASVDMGDIMESSWHAFTFPPILDSKDRQFYFYLEAPEAPLGSAVSVWMSTSDVYADGTAYSDHQPIQGDLAFRTFYLSGLGEGVKEMPTETHELMNRVQNLQWDLRQVGAELAMIQASRAYQVCSRLGLIGRRSVGPRYRPWSAQAPLVIKVWRCLRYMGIRGLLNEARAYLHWRFVLKGRT